MAAAPHQSFLQALATSSAAVCNWKSLLNRDVDSHQGHFAGVIHVFAAQKHHAPVFDRGA